MLQREVKGTFLEHLWSLIGKWMWEYIKEGETDILWIRDALTTTTGTLVGVTDGSYKDTRQSPAAGQDGSSMQTI
jgi:hypothetical protein